MIGPDSVNSSSLVLFASCVLHGYVRTSEFQLLKVSVLQATHQCSNRSNSRAKYRTQPMESQQLQLHWSQQLQLHW